MHDHSKKMGLTCAPIVCLLLYGAIILGFTVFRSVWAATFLYHFLVVAAVLSMPAPAPVVPEPTPVKLPASSVARPDSIAGPADDPAVELPGSDVSPFELMQFWWKQANPIERKRFFEWTVEQE